MGAHNLTGIQKQIEKHHHMTPTYTKDIFISHDWQMGAHNLTGIQKQIETSSHDNIH